jgi:hypothetical protein
LAKLSEFIFLCPELFHEIARDVCRAGRGLRFFNARVDPWFRPLCREYATLSGGQEALFDQFVRGERRLSGFVGFLFVGNPAKIGTVKDARL